MCTAETLAALQGALLPYADRGGVAQPATSLLHQLLLKASADKRFIMEEVRALMEFLGSMLGKFGGWG